MVRRLNNNNNLKVDVCHWLIYCTGTLQSCRRIYVQQTLIITNSWILPWMLMDSIASFVTAIQRVIPRVKTISLQLPQGEKTQKNVW